MSELEGRQHMSGSARLERGYRRLLACYPRPYRRENEEEILAVLLACAHDGQRRPGLASSADLIKGAMLMRLWPAARPPRTVQTAVRLMCAGVAAELAYLIINVATAGSVGSAYARGYPPWAAAAVRHAVTVQMVKDNVGAVIAIGVWLLLAWALARGRNLARFAFAACLCLDSLAVVSAIGQGAAAHAHADMAAATAVWLVILAASVLLFTGASNRYYRAKPRAVTRVAPCPPGHGKHRAGRNGRKSRNGYGARTLAGIRRNGTWNDARY
jgi:hypothetical protein